MGKVKVLKDTTFFPITMIGEMSGICYNSNIENTEKNYKRGIENIESNHGRTLEFPQVYLSLEGYSARVIRELYTHIGGMPTRLQASTRYIKYGEFKYITPPTIENNDQSKEKYNNIMNQIQNCYKDLLSLNISKEDAANILPLGMESNVVIRTNLRNLLDMAKQRLCTRAYWEYRQLMKDIIDGLYKYSSEWRYIVKNYFKCKCEIYMYCEEKKSCGRFPKKEEVLKYAKNLEDDLK